MQSVPEVWFTRETVQARVVVCDRGRRGLLRALGGLDGGIAREVAVGLGGFLVRALGAEAGLGPATEILDERHCDGRLAQERLHNPGDKLVDPGSVSEQWLS